MNFIQATISAQIAHFRHKQSSDKQAILTEIYIEALLVDKELADQVWEASIAEKLTDGAVCIAWLLIAGLLSPRDH